MRYFIVLLLLVCSGNFGCGAKPTSLIASSSPVPPGVRGTIPTSGSNCQYFLLGLIPITGSPDSQDALDRAKSNADVDVLTDITIDHGGYYLILFSTSCVRIKGKGIPRDILSAADARANLR